MRGARVSMVGTTHNFRKLKIYQRAIAFAVEIYKLSKDFPKSETYGLTGQIRRAVTSISLNIAEGSGSSSAKEFQRFLDIARRSTYEVMSCLEIAVRLGHCVEKDVEKLGVEADEIAAMITSFSQGLQSDV